MVGQGEERIPINYADKPQGHPPANVEEGNRPLKRGDLDTTEAMVVRNAGMGVRVNWFLGGWCVCSMHMVALFGNRSSATTKHDCQCVLSTPVIALPSYFAIPHRYCQKMYFGQFTDANLDRTNNLRPETAAAIAQRVCCVRAHGSTLLVNMIDIFGFLLKKFQDQHA